MLLNSCTYTLFYFKVKMIVSIAHSVFFGKSTLNFFSHHGRVLSRYFLKKFRLEEKLKNRVLKIIPSPEIFHKPFLLSFTNFLPRVGHNSHFLKRCRLLTQTTTYSLLIPLKHFNFSPYSYILPKYIIPPTLIISNF